MKPAPDAAPARRPPFALRALGASVVTCALGACADGGAGGGSSPDWFAWALVVAAAALGMAVGASWGAARHRAGLDRLSRQAAEINPARPDARLEATGGRAVGRLVQEMNRMLARLESGLAARDRFTAEVSHEFKTPVSVLLLEAQVVARSGADPVTLARFVTSVEEEMRRLSKLIESFLTLARIEHGDEMRRIPTDVNEIAMEAGEHCWPSARLRDLRLAFSLALAGEGGHTPQVAGIPDLLRTMIENLLRNAIAVSPRGSIVDLRVAYDGPCATVAVRDKGPGVPDAIAHRIFERFVSGDAGRNGAHGSGIGLTIARGIARAHGGEVSFRNLPAEEGGGAEFSARIPLLNGDGGATEASP